MLENREALRNAMVRAHKRAVMVMGDHGTPDLTRFDVIQDDAGYQVGAVSPRYRLIQNADLIGAIDLASDELGVTLTAEKGAYNHGKSWMSFSLPDAFKVPGDPSEIKPMINIGNDYGGGGALTGGAGVYRLICTNGMMVGKIERAQSQRHVGNIDVYEFVYGLVDHLVKRAEVSKIIAETTQDMPFEWRLPDIVQEHVQDKLVQNAQLLNVIAENTPPRYHDPLRQAIMENRKEIGHTVWALLQAISEVSTHNMRGWAAQNWQRKETNRILEHVEVPVTL